jgi:site-specific DNA-methyltransferase (adenine-specific)
MSLPKPYYSDDAVTIYHADCRDILPELPKVDLVLTDPPYGIDLDTTNTKYKNGIKRERLTGDAEPFDPTPLLSVNCPSIVWGGNCFASRLPDFHGWLCWVKTVRDGSKIRQADMELAWTNFVRRPRALQHLWIGAYRDSESGEQASHPSQKPAALMLWCINIAQEYLDVGLILDPFLGSGTTAFAAKKLGRKCIGIEIEERYCEIAARRCSQTVMDLQDDSATPGQPRDAQGRFIGIGETSNTPTPMEAPTN